MEKFASKSWHIPEWIRLTPLYDGFDDEEVLHPKYYPTNSGNRKPSTVAKERKRVETDWQDWELDLLKAEMKKPRIDYKYLCEKTGRTKSAAKGARVRLTKKWGIVTNKRWTDEDMDALRKMVEADDHDFEREAERTGRTPGAIQTRYYRVKWGMS